MSHSGGPHGPNHWAVRHSGASRRYCLGGRLYLGAAWAWSIEEMKKPPGVDRRYAGFTFGYNRPLLANRVHDILTAVAYEKAPEKTTIHLVGFEAAGPWVILARALCGEMVARTAADLNGFRFENVQSNGDQMMLPGALKYGGLPAFAALCAPHELLVHNLEGCGSSDWLKAAFQATGSHDHLTENRDKVSPEKVVQWLLR